MWDNDGVLLHRGVNLSETGTEMPVIANIDDDPWAEILISGRSGIVAYE